MRRVRRALPPESRATNCCGHSQSSHPSLPTNSHATQPRSAYACTEACNLFHLRPSGRIGKSRCPPLGTVRVMMMQSAASTQLETDNCRSVQNHHFYSKEKGTLFLCERLFPLRICTHTRRLCVKYNVTALPRWQREKQREEEGATGGMTVQPAGFQGCSFYLLQTT